jgi:hypothetical protein
MQSLMFLYYSNNLTVGKVLYATIKMNRLCSTFYTFLLRTLFFCFLLLQIVIVIIIIYYQFINQDRPMNKFNWRSLWSKLASLQFEKREFVFVLLTLDLFSFFQISALQLQFYCFCGYMTKYYFFIFLKNLKMT